MSEDVFRIVVTAAVSLAALAFVVQTGVVIAFYRGYKREVQPVFTKVGPILEDKVRPAIEKIGPLAEKITLMVDKATTALATTNQIMEETRPRISEITAETAALARSGREHVDHLASILLDASERARTRLEQIDQTVESTVAQVEHVSDSMKRVVMRPVKEVNGVAAGISAAVSTLVHGSRRSSVESATQDEEMFI